MTALRKFFAPWPNNRGINYPETSRRYKNVNFLWSRYLDRSEEERERDKLRHDRHKERERDRRISKAAPDKRFVCCLLLKKTFHGDILKSPNPLCARRKYEKCRLYQTITWFMIQVKLLSNGRKDNTEESESSAGFEPATSVSLVGCSTHWATRMPWEQGRLCRSWMDNRDLKIYDDGDIDENVTSKYG